MYSKRSIIRCDIGYRADGSYCGNSIEAHYKGDAKRKAKGLGWKTQRSFFDLATHICPECQRVAAGLPKAETAVAK